MAESFTLTVPLLIKNPSDAKIRIRNLRPILELPDGYQQHVYYESLNSPEGRDVAPKDFLSCRFGIAVNTRGREKGVNDQNPEYVENKNKILVQIKTARIGFSLRFETISLKGMRADEVKFDLTEELLSQIKEEK